jgi:hypothetical protein
MQNFVTDNKTNTSSIFKNAFSTEGLLTAYYQIKTNPENLTTGYYSETFKNIDLKWFKIASIKLLNGTFLYPKTRRIFTAYKSVYEKRFLTLTSPRIKIIEKSILNGLEPKFEGNFVWEKVPEDIYNSFCKSNNHRITVIKNKSGFFMKNWDKTPIFSRFSFGSRSQLSAHNALNLIKNWPTNLNWFLKMDINKIFNNVNYNRLKNIFLKYCPDNHIWNELNKLIKAGIINLNTDTQANSNILQGSILSPFLFNVYLTELDKFIEQLQSVYDTTKQAIKGSKQINIQNEYELFSRRFRIKHGLATTLADVGSPQMVLESNLIWLENEIKAQKVTILKRLKLDR